MTAHDVAVVGGGPVGLVLGCLLAQRHIDVAVFEARATMTDRGRAVGILPPGLRVLAEAGVAAEARAHGLVVPGGVGWSRGRRIAALPFDDTVLTLPQSELMSILRDRLGTLSPDALRSGTRVDEVRQAGDRVTFTARTDTTARAHTARVLVAADGVRSGIRRALGIPWRRSRGHGWYMMDDVDDTSDLGPWAHLFLEGDGIVESFPLPRDRRRWVARIADAAVIDPPSLTQTIRRRTGHEVTAATPSTFEVRQHRATRLAVDRIVLVGDAAHEISPIGGQGMNLGWLGARRVARDIIDALERDRPDFTAYARAQQRSARRAQRRARFNMGMGAPAPRAVEAARRLVMRGLGHPVFHRQLLRLFTMRGL